MEPLVQLQGISKRFGGVQALKDVSFTINKGEIHGLVGENGAGKSTLIKIMGGVYTKDEGEVFFDGRPVNVTSPSEAQELGISIVHQEIPLCPNLTVAQNVFMASPIVTRWGRADWKAMEDRTVELFSQIGQYIDPRRRVGTLSVAEQQLTAIVQALRARCRFLIMDEPTSALTPGEVDTLFSVLRRLRGDGTTILFVSHILSEVFDITDRITVFRNGRHVDTRPTSELTVSDVVRLMVGEVNIEERATGSRPKGEVVLEVESLSQSSLGLKDVSFQLRRGEILGIAGIQGAGRTELAMTLFGVHPATSGTVKLLGREVKITSPSQAIELGIGYLTEDRRNLGVFWEMSTGENMIAAIVDRLRRPLGALDRGEGRRLGEKAVSQLLIRTPSLDQGIRFLSGGNQQKALLARWLNVGPTVLILDEPTRGVDVGAKVEIRKAVRELVERGISIIVISSDLDELFRLSDRLLVMSAGRVQGEMTAQEATKESVIALATVK